MVTFSYPPDFKIAMPTHDELDALLSISRGFLFPAARPLDHADVLEFRRQFGRAFEFIATLKRTPGEFRGRLSDWVDKCETWHAARGCTESTTSIGPLLAAAVSAGDVDWQRGSDWPHNIHAAIDWSNGIGATDAWREVIRTGRVRRMTPIRERYAPPSPARIYHPDEA